MSPTWPLRRLNLLPPTPSEQPRCICTHLPSPAITLCSTMTVGHHSRHIACDARAISSTEPLAATQHRHPAKGVPTTGSKVVSKASIAPMAPPGTGLSIRAMRVSSRAALADSSLSPHFACPKSGSGSASVFSPDAASHRAMLGGWATRAGSRSIPHIGWARSSVPCGSNLTSGCAILGVPCGLDLTIGATHPPSTSVSTIATLVVALGQAQPFDIKE